MKKKKEKQKWNSSIFKYKPDKWVKWRDLVDDHCVIKVWWTIKSDVSL